ncbi:MAG: hypothetical protein Q4Q00_10010 [Turicibacter sp.]|nr:hypothetical protein [Turicibacter sp.]
MKRVSLLLGLTLIALSGCAGNNESTTISTPQSLQSLSITKTTGNSSSTVTNSSTEGETSDASDSSAESNSTQTTEKTFATQQEFVDYMYEKVTALEDTISLLDSNLTQVYSVVGTDAEAAQLSIRENLLNQTTNEMNTIEALLRPTEEVATLQEYVVKAYDYNIQYKTAEYEIFQAETLEERQTLLDSNAEVERQAQNYLTLAWSEIDRLSETSYDRK